MGVLWISAFYDSWQPTPVAPAISKNPGQGCSGFYSQGQPLAEGWPFFFFGTLIKHISLVRCKLHLHWKNLACMSIHVDYSIDLSVCQDNVCLIGREFYMTLCAIPSKPRESSVQQKARGADVCLLAPDVFAKRPDLRGRWFVPPPSVGPQPAQLREKRTGKSFGENV